MKIGELLYYLDLNGGNISKTALTIKKSRSGIHSRLKRQYLKLFKTHNKIYFESTFNSED